MLVLVSIHCIMRLQKNKVVFIPICIRLFKNKTFSLEYDCLCPYLPTYFMSCFRTVLAKTFVRRQRILASTGAWAEGSIVIGCELVLCILGGRWGR